MSMRFSRLLPVGMREVPRTYRYIDDQTAHTVQEALPSMIRGPMEHHTGLTQRIFVLN